MNTDMHDEPASPRIPRTADIEAAGRRIAPYLRRTPVIEMDTRACGVRGASLVLKLESLQYSGSFKPRGACNRVLSQDKTPSALIAASGGNHGAAVAYVGQRLGIPAEIFVPQIASPAKLARIREYGAQLRVGGRDYAEALDACREREAASDALAVHAYDQFEVVAGQGTLALELQRQAPDLDTLLVAVGGGGLIGGIAAAYAGQTRVIGVEPGQCRALAAALEAGHPVDVPVSGVAADSLGARRVGGIAFAVAQRFVERVVEVEDAAILEAQAWLWRELRIAAEPGGAAAMAALLDQAYRPQANERVGIIICGGNCDPAELQSGDTVD